MKRITLAIILLFLIPAFPNWVNAQSLEIVDSLFYEHFGYWPAMEGGDASTYAGFSGRTKATYSGNNVYIQGWGGGTGYPQASGNACLLAKGANESTPLVISDIDVSGYPEIVLTFGLAWQRWWADPGIPYFRPTIEVKLDNGSWIKLTQTTSQYPTVDQEFKVIELPVVNEQGVSITGNRLSIRISSEANNAYYRLDDLYVLGKVDIGIKITKITVASETGATSITTPGGTLQMKAIIAPDSATNKNVTWSLIEGSGKAIISPSGLLKAVTNGYVIVRATAKDKSGVLGDAKIIISNQGSFLEPYTDAQASKIASVPDYVPMINPVEASTVKIQVYAADTLTKVSKQIYGTNANQYTGNYNEYPKLIKHIKQLAPGTIRYPGGLHSDGYFWNVEWDWNLTDPYGNHWGWFKNMPSDVPDSVMNSDGTISRVGWTPGKGYWTFGLDDFYKFIDSTGQEPIITVNYGYARYGTGPNPVQTAAHMAADWVRYDNGRTKYWEVGNENVAFWSSSYRIDIRKNKDGQPEFITSALYGAHFKVFADSMRKAAAEIGHTIYIGAQHDGEFFTTAGDAADWFVVHDYFTPFIQNSSVSTILNSAKTTVEMHANIAVAQTQKYGTKLKPIGMTEWNIFAEGSKQTSSYINGMHGVLTIGESIKHKYAMAHRWNIANAWNNGEDMGMFSSNTGQPWDTNPDERWNPRAPFYYLYYFQKYFGDYMVNSTVEGSADIVAYASKFSSGQSGIVVVNKGTSSQVIDLALNSFKYGKRYYIYSLSGGQDNGDFSLSVFVNGQGPGRTIIGGPIDSLETIKAWSAPIDGLIKFSSPALSVQFILVENDPNEIIAGHTYAITAKHSGKALSVRSEQTKNGIDIQQDKYTGKNNQKWTIEEAGSGYYKLLAAHSAKSLSIAKASVKKGAKAEQWEYVGGNHQKWKLEEIGNGFYKLTAAHSSKVLSVSHGQTKNGATIEQTDYIGADYQKWKFERVTIDTTSVNPCQNLLADFEGKKITLFPNPTQSGNFTLDFTDFAFKENAVVNVLDMRGKTKYKKTISNEKLVKVDLRLPIGIYIIRVEYNKGVITGRLIVN